MRINQENQSMDIEIRDLNFIIDQYAINYKFATKNAPLERVIIPMFGTAKTRYGEIPIEFVPDVSGYVKELVEDGKAVAEASPQQADEIAVQDAKKQHIASELGTVIGKTTVPELSVQKISKVDTNRVPKQPSGPIIPPGSGGLSLSPRDPADLRHTAADLAPEKDIDENKQKAVEVKVGEDGNKRLA